MSVSMLFYSGIRILCLQSQGERALWDAESGKTFPFEEKFGFCPHPSQKREGEKSGSSDGMKTVVS